MGYYLPIEQALEVDTSLVGQKAKKLASQKDFLPFSLVITTDTFKEFIRYNNLEANINISLNNMELSTSSIIIAFQELAAEFKKARFPEEVQQNLQECFDLLCLDTNKLDLLSNEKAPKHTILGMIRSTTGEDKDALSYRILCTKDSFEAFLDTIKSVYLSLFTPSAIAKRMGTKEKIEPSIVLYRLPNIAASFESMADPSTKQIIVRSYLGYPDFSGEVKRDQFYVGYDFLKIQKSKIIPQQKVAVFDLQTNRIVTKKYDSISSSQSAPDPVILEIARLTKKFATDQVGQGIFIQTSEGNIKLLDMFTQQPTQKTVMTETDHLNTLRENVIKFLGNYAHEEDYKETIDILLRSLKTDKSVQSLTQGVLLVKELLEKLH